MDKLKLIRNCLKEILQTYGNARIQDGNPLDFEIIIDSERDKFLLYLTGWEGEKRIHECVLHFSVFKEKIYIQQDNTGIPIEDILCEKGIARENIVLAYIHPDRREDSGYAKS
ncbi:MAG: XisI protein [Leptospiraceae bacterium]|nr:XisI protein [Leptospiraceae bacterium]MCP5502086.1 XisI protein [Leptospiraceae bacterium]